MAAQIVFDGKLLCKCERCGWVWLARQGKGIKDVKNCTRCRSEKWNERKEENEVIST